MKTLLITPLFKGFTLGASLIVAIGPQNAFVLKQGLKRQYLFITAFLCFACDVALITFGVNGLTAVLNSHPLWVHLMRYGGALFLSFYALQLLRSAFKTNYLAAEQSDKNASSIAATVVTILALTLLNPHVYIDTMLLLGSIGAQLPPAEHLPFIMGTLLASLVWFFGLAYGARLLSPVFKNPKAWRILDLAMAALMAGIALSLLIQTH